MRKGQMWRDPQYVSSIASLLPLPNSAVYAATKAYATSFSEAVSGRAAFRPTFSVTNVYVQDLFRQKYLSHATRAGEPQKHTPLRTVLLFPSKESCDKALKARNERPRKSDSWHYREFGNDGSRLPSNVYQAGCVQRTSEASTARPAKPHR